MTVEIKKDKHGYKHLYIDNVDWMEDVPSEKELQESAARLARKDTLVAGLGLGLYQKEALKNPRLRSLTTIEINQEVIDLMKTEDPELMSDLRHTIICADFFTWIPDKRYNVVYGDIWMSANDIDLWIAFKEKAYKDCVKEGGLVYGWLDTQIENEYKKREYIEKLHRNKSQEMKNGVR